MISLVGPAVVAAVKQNNKMDEHVQLATYDDYIYCDNIRNDERIK